LTVVPSITGLASDVARNRVPRDFTLLVLRLNIARRYRRIS